MVERGITCVCPKCGKPIKILISKRIAKILYKSYKGVIVH